MSTMRFISTTAKARNRVVPWIVTRSPRWIASNERRPMPGMPNTDSVRIAPPTRMPRARPSTVMTGGVAGERLDDRRDRGAQAVADDDPPLGETLRARRAHVVLRHHLEQVRPRE